MECTDDRGKKAMGEYFSGFPGAIPTQSEQVGKVLAVVKTEGTKIAGIGYCWGYKVIVVASDVGKFDAIAGVHPS